MTMYIFLIYLAGIVGSLKDTLFGLSVVESC